MDRVFQYYTARIFTLSGYIDAFSFILSLMILFFPRTKFNMKTVLIAIAHFAGMYAGLLLLGGAAYLAVDVDVVINYVPKLVVMCLYAFFFSDYKWQSRVILCASVYTLNHCFIEIGGSLTGVFSARVQNPTGEYVRCGMMICTVGVAALLRFFNIDRFNNIPTRAVAEVLGYSVIGVAIAMLRSLFIPYFGKFEQTENYIYSFVSHLYVTITLLCIIIFIFACYFFLVRNIQANEENMQLSKKAIRLENSRALIAFNENNLKQICKIKHEIKNRYAIMQVMLENKQYDKLSAYFHEINSEAIVPLSQVNTGNTSFDMVLNLEITKALAEKIEVSTKLMIPPEINVSESDIDGLITNLIDNAIEACEKIEREKKQIEITAQTMHNYLVLSVSNTIAEDRARTALSLETEKEDKQLHGIGSKIIDDIVDKYGGQILRRVENNRFSVDLMLDMAYRNG